jgi:hypothetical protein
MALPFAVPNRRETLGKQKNQRHAFCPENLNRTAVGEDPAIHLGGFGVRRVMTSGA